MEVKQWRSNTYNRDQIGHIITVWFYCYRFKCKCEDNSVCEALGLDSAETHVVKSPHGNAVQVPKVTAVKCNKGTREEYIRNIQELKLEVAKTKPNKIHMKRLLQVIINDCINTFYMNCIITSSVFSLQVMFSSGVCVYLSACVSVHFICLSCMP